MTGPPPGAAAATGDPRRAAGRFAAGVAGVRPFGGGHINETFLVGTPTGDLVVQRLNLAVFPDPDAVTGNVIAVHDHLRGAFMPEPVPTGDGHWLLRDGSGVWRGWGRGPGAGGRSGPTPTVGPGGGRPLRGVPPPVARPRPPARA